MSNDMFILTPDVSLRKVVTLDGEEVVSIVDFMTWVLDKKDDGSYAKNLWLMLKSNLDYKDIHNDIKRERMRRGNSRNTYVVDCMTIDGLENLMLILGGKIAGTWRKIVLDAFRREKAKKNGANIEHKAEVALILPGVVIQSKGQAQMYLDTKKIEAEALKTNAETEKIEAEKKISEENNAQRAHEVTMKDIRKLELQVELAKMQSQAPAQTKDTNEQSQPAKEMAAAASAAPTPAKEKAREKAPPQKGIHKPTYSRAKKGARGKVKKPSSRAKDKSKPAGEGHTKSIRAYFDKMTLNTDK